MPIVLWTSLAPQQAQSVAAGSRTLAASRPPHVAAFAESVSSDDTLYFVAGQLTQKQR